MTPCISVIMPVYNAEETLAVAVASVLAQSLQTYELLLVDDGSTDGSLPLCRTLAVQDSRIRVITQPNRGICAARNAGIAQAQGQYLAFCDDDDVFLPDALQRLFDLAESTGADVVRGGYLLLRQREDGTMTELPHASGRACRLDEETKRYGDFLCNSGPQFVWNALYRRRALEGLRFDETCRFGLEDFLFNAQVYTRIRMAVYDPQPVYRHHERLTSTSAARTDEAFRARLDALAPWLEAEYYAAGRWCDAKALPGVWNARKAEAVAFLMHQLRAMRADQAQRRCAWETLRGILRPYPYSLPRGRGMTLKRRAALWLFCLHLQGLFEILPDKEGSL